MSPKALAVAGLFALVGGRLTTCRSPGEGGGDASQPRAEKVVELKGVDTQALTARERAEWSANVSQLLSPCPDQPVSVAQCVSEERKCAACLPAARYLVEQVRRGRTRTQVEAAYRGRFAADQVKNIELGDAPSRGPSGAPILIVEFADFECPACGAARPVVEKVVEHNAQSIRLVFKHFPLSIHPNAEKAARAAVAAHRQGKFWPVYATLFDNQQALSPENVERLVQPLGLDMARFQKDRDSETTADAVARDRKQGEALDISSTPTLFINGRRFESSGEMLQDLEDWIALELTLVGAHGGTAEPTPSTAPAPAPAASHPPAAPSGAASATRAP